MSGVEQLMREHGVERIVRVPPTPDVPRESFHIHLADGWLAEHIGRGDSVRTALHDAVQRTRKVAA